MQAGWHIEQGGSAKLAQSRRVIVQDKSQLTFAARRVAQVSKARSQCRSALQSVGRSHNLAIADGTKHNRGDCAIHFWQIVHDDGLHGRGTTFVPFLLALHLERLNNHVWYVQPGQ